MKKDLKAKYKKDPVWTYLPHAEKFVGVGGKTTGKKGQAIPEATDDEYEELMNFNPHFFKKPIKKPVDVQKRKTPVSESGTGQRKAE